jgi:hypothetical protein
MRDTRGLFLPDEIAVEEAQSRYRATEAVRFGTLQQKTRLHD